VPTRAHRERTQNVNEEAATAPQRLSIRNFAQIVEADIDFGDLTVLVGAQGTGKSLALQWLKTALDGRLIVSALRDAGQDVADPEVLIDLIFGVGMGASWHPDSEVLFNRTKIRPSAIAKLGDGSERVFFIPAHRSMLISDGWAAPFQKLTADTPVVARIFSQNLFNRFSARGGDALFPLDRVLKKEYRDLIDSAVFSAFDPGGWSRIDSMLRVKLTHGEAQLPFMTWTAGQREFTPLLLGLYHLLPPRKILKQPDINWVVIEEPEMGYIRRPSAFYCCSLSTCSGAAIASFFRHTRRMWTAIWMLRRLQEHHARWQLVCQAFGVHESHALRKVAEAALKKAYRVHFFEFGRDGKVRSTDISDLDPDSEDEGMAGWGGLTAFSSRFGDAVRTAVNESAE
jgi:hypothetical protein